ncbi:helix-turn-helix domain-containing protein [Acidovorax sp. Leaf160]|uniref:MarR family transcriptional regulator n=1 Tax=Acidovorax sp. Leaf160 TaxID=1736280 RepID=UPI0006F29EE5|nr:helix-turn-helix domain-containing protein [Acidovorax sp. Leaf160]KQR37835.1 hypothetical protein ASF94_14050 [Acidovorax sp. Leaf160]
MPTTSRTVAAHLLSATSRDRFRHLLTLASPHAVCQWHEAEAAQAQLWLLDASSTIPAGAQPPLCVICIGPAVPEQTPPACWLTRLGDGHTAADLADVLDRAAMFLTDWEAWQASQRARVPLAAAPPASPALQRWRLRAWPSLGAPYDTGPHLRALALLSREAVTVEQIGRHAGLEHARVLQLLAELQRRGLVRRTREPAHRCAPAAAPTALPVSSPLSAPVSSAVSSPLAWATARPASAPPAQPIRQWIPQSITQPIPQSTTWPTAPLAPAAALSRRARAHASGVVGCPGPVPAGLARRLSSWVGSQGCGR